MLSKLILFLSAVLVLIIIFDRVQNNIVFTLYFKYEGKDSDGVEKLPFHDYLKNFNKSYDRTEFQMRYRLFKENLVKIDKLNRESRYATYGVTEFSDWTKEELAAILIPNVGNCEPLNKTCDDVVRRSAENRRNDKNQYRINCCKKRGSRYVSNNDTKPAKEEFAKLHNDKNCKCETHRPKVAKNRRIKKPIPPKVDWRERHAVGPVLNQRRCPACWAFSIIGVMESRAFIQNHSFNLLSIQDMLDCTFYKEKDRTGCHFGRPIVDAIKYLCETQYKVTTEERYPLTLLDEQCHSTAPGVRGISRFVNSCDMYENENKLLEVLADGPVTAMVSAELLFNYNSGIIAENCETTADKLNHAVQLVGYDKTGESHYYILKNSWDTTWGEGGYARLAIGRNQCGIAFSIGYFDVN